MKKNSIIAFVLALFTVLFLSNFRLLQKLYLMPNILWLLPLFGFYFLSVFYFSKAFNIKQKIIYKILIILFGGLGVVSLFYIGFSVWKINQGNIFMKIQEDFQMNLKNIFFWVTFQSYLFLFFFSSFKQLVTIDQK